jgi:Tektin family
LCCSTDRDSRWCVAECAKTSDVNQRSSTRLLSERAQQIRGVHADLAKVSWMCREEEEHLETQRQRVKRSIAALTPPALINTECLNRRRCRLEQDLVNDDVELELHKVFYYVLQFLSNFAEFELKKCYIRLLSLNKMLILGFEIIFLGLM